ncbi:MAG TPA: 4-(cytidine 5'-diphospho)-2-C-methyl-D-erythritol kinase [Rhizomicrobium sp.]|nr:4-(cytidine 5'-diphospho)-2-C-methyl-D-erythritol kinase [Rhizomicrobium sp.]
MVRVHAPAKINLFLHVTGKRPDGFHDLQSLVAFADVGDVLLLERRPDFALTIEGPFGEGLESDANNLVLKAARALAPQLTGAARFRLVKNLPVASGIGGGSADAAAALRGLLALESRDFAGEADLVVLAATLGSDIPVCLASRAAWMEGRGERVTELPVLPPAHMVLVNPGVSVSTAEVFRRLVRRDETRLSPPPAFASLDALVDYLKETRNDLEAPALAIAPVIGRVLQALTREGAAFTRMSGSGATCFGLFESAESANAAANAIAGAEPSWWARAAAFAPPEFAYPR